MPANSALLARTPLVGRTQEIVGYDVRLTPGESNAAQGLARLLAGAGEQNIFARLPGNRLVFTDAAQIDLEKPLSKAGGRLVLEHPAAGQTAETLIAQEKKTKGASYAVCLDQAHAQDLPAEALELASYLHLDAQALNGEFERTAKRLRKYPAKQIAVNVETPEQFDRAYAAGCDLFKGYYFTRPALEASQAVSPSYTTIAMVMKLAQENAPVAKIEEALKRDAALSFKLLRYINSAGFGLSCEIQSFRHAVTVLGYQNLYRWLALLMVTAAKQSASSALVTTAVTRGRLAEVIAEGLFEQQERDNLFIVGAFSLLEAILRAPLDQIVEQIPLSEAVLDALFRHEGPYGPILSVVEAMEGGVPAETRAQALETAELLGVNPAQLNQAQLEALIWAEGLSRA